MRVLGLRLARLAPLYATIWSTGSQCRPRAEDAVKSEYGTLTKHRATRSDRHAAVAASANGYLPSGGERCILSLHVRLCSVTRHRHERAVSVGPDPPSWRPDEAKVAQEQWRDPVKMPSPSSAIAPLLPETWRFRRFRAHEGSSMADMAASEPLSVEKQKLPIADLWEGVCLYV